MIKKSVKEEKLPEKELRKKFNSVRKKVKKGQKQKKINLPNTDHVYGLASPKHEDIADLIYNTYGNKAEEDLKKSYDAYIAEKSKVYHRPKVVPRFISPKVEEMKKKEEERKANDLDAIFEEEKKEPEKPLYKLKMFMNVGSKVTEGIKKFRTYKPLMHINIHPVSKSQEKETSNINNIIDDIQKDVQEKEKIEQIGNNLTSNKNNN